MNKAFDKILERLEELHERYVNQYDMIDKNPMAFSVKECMKIVQKVAEEYNGGWIACSEMLPEIGQEVIVSSQNGSVYSNIYYDYIDNNAKEPCFHRWDDEMWNCFMLDVIAWQPLPEPFKERD